MHQVYVEGREEGRLVVDVGRDSAHSVYLSEIELSNGAKKAVEEAVEQIAESLDVTAEQLSRRVYNRTFWLEPSEKLVIVFETEDREAEFVVEIPRKHWDFREVSGFTQ